MLTSGRKMSSARRERPMAMPMATPATAASAKPAARRTQRVEHVVRQDARGGEAHEGRRDVFQRRKQLARKDAELRDDFPEQPDHQERKRVARDDPEPALAASGRDPGSEGTRRCGGRKIAHEATIVRKSPVGQAHSASRACRGGAVAASSISSDGRLPAARRADVACRSRPASAATTDHRKEEPHGPARRR